MHKTGLLAIPLAAVMAVSMIITPSAYASWVTKNDPSDFDANDNFDIRQVGITDDGNLRLKVDGTVGATRPDGVGQENLVYAYVFLSNVGIIAVTSHQAEDSGQVVNDLEWHTHRVTLNSDFCVTSIIDFGKAKLHKDRLDVRGTGATSVDGAVTAELTITPDDPETEQNEFKVCVSGVWDEAPDGVVSGG